MEQVSQPSKFPKVMIFREDVLSNAIGDKYFSKALETFYVHQFYKKMQWDNTSQLGDYGASFCEEQYWHEFLFFFVQIQIV